MADGEASRRFGSAIGMGDLHQRVVVGVAAGVVAITALCVGGWLLWLLVGAGALVALTEWIGLVHSERPRSGLGLLILAITLIFLAPSLWGSDRATVALLLILALLMLLVPRTSAAAWGVAYIGLAAIGLLFLREQPNGLALALWTVAIVWATDIGAYFAGRYVGGAKLAPRISPGKTWAGLAGGVVTAGIVGAAIAVIGHLPATAIWSGGLFAVVAQAGDLMESWLKRRVGVKDSGTLLPGHGGLLDRIDGMIPVVILVAALVANGTF